MVAPEQSRTTLVRAVRPPAEPSTIVLVVSGPLARADIAPLCERARVLLEGSDAERVVCDVGALVDSDAVTVEALARLQLTVRRLGRRVRLRRACGELQELLALTGLRGVLPLCTGLPLEPRGQAEDGEQARGVEEEGDPADPAV
ncbi:MAG: STAS domain-containing protein [Actinomycetota bacterium]